MKGEKKPKAVHYELIPPANKALYKLLARLVDKYHTELKDARIALAWCTSWRCDVDGKQKLGQCKKASDLDRELHDYDFVILLHRPFFEDPTVDDNKRKALIDHELCHATVKVDPETLEPVRDEKDRIVYRLRKHDLEEFAEIAARYGLWKRDLEAFAAALAKSKQGTLPMEDQAEATTH